MSIPTPSTATSPGRPPRRRRRRAAPAAATVLLGVVLLAAGCVTTGPQGEQSLILIDTAQEVEIGRGVDQNIRQEFAVLQDEAIQRYVDEVGARLARHADRQDVEYTFTVLDDSMVNAFAAPGGWVYVTTGLMRTAETDAELAGVLGHEIGHVVGRHSIRQLQAAYGAGLAADILLGDRQTMKAIIGLATQVALLKNSREHELESDEFGIKYAIAAGYDPRGIVDFFEKLMAEQGSGGSSSGVAAWFSTHPTTRERIEKARQLLQEYHPDYSRLENDRADYLRITAPLR